MVVLMTQEFRGVSREDAEEVSSRMNVHENPPTGLIAHVLTDIPGGIRATDIWESEADFQMFAEERLIRSLVRSQRSAASPSMGLDSPCSRRPTTSTFRDGRAGPRATIGGSQSGKNGGGGGGRRAHRLRRV
jgi:hypothetical protein